MMGIGMVDNLYCGDCLEVMKDMPDNSVDSIVTDPPYGISFMNNKWDYDVPKVEIWIEALRILKPGGHLLCFAGTRTQHRMACNIEDAGFEIKNMIAWVFGSGFPNSLNVSKAIDKMAGADREIIGDNIRLGRKKSSPRNTNKDNNNAFCLDYQTLGYITAPATEEAKRWSGFGSGLKPAFEPITLARKPLSESNIASNVLKHGTGALNIDGCRIEIDKKKETDNRVGTDYTLNLTKKSDRRTVSLPLLNKQLYKSEGRWPANFIHDGSEEVEALFPYTVGKWGVSKTPYKESIFIKNKDKYAQAQLDRCNEFIGDAGSASRFFYCAKASKQDRDEGLQEFIDKDSALNFGGELDGKGDPINIHPRKNNHPTVKPTSLLRYLVRLVTPPDGTCIDPFMGSGSTGKACAYEGFKFIGIDLNPEYVGIAKARIEYALNEKIESERQLELF